MCIDPAAAYGESGEEAVPPRRNRESSNRSRISISLNTSRAVTFCGRNRIRISSGWGYSRSVRKESNRISVWIFSCLLSFTISLGYSPPSRVRMR
jgi:hypothetical protein